MCNNCDQISETQRGFFMYYWVVYCIDDNSENYCLGQSFYFYFHFYLLIYLFLGVYDPADPIVRIREKKDILSRHRHIAGIFSTNWQVYILKYFLIVKALYTMRTSQWVQTFKWFTQIERECQKMAGRNILRWNYVVKATHRFLKASFMSGKPNQSIGDAV